MLRTVRRMDGREWLASYRRRLQEFGERAERAQRELGAVCVTATSPDGAVTVTVTSTGALQGLVLSERAEGMPRDRLAEAVLATARTAHGDAARRATEVVAPLIGDHSAAMAVLRSHLQDGDR